MYTILHFWKLHTPVWPWCGHKLSSENPPLSAENPKIFGQKIPHLKVIFFKFQKIGKKFLT